VERKRFTSGGFLREGGGKTQDEKARHVKGRPQEGFGGKKPRTPGAQRKLGLGPTLILLESAPSIEKTRGELGAGKKKLMRKWREKEGR